jgi:hypothetical protein
LFAAASSRALVAAALASLATMPSWTAKACQPLLVCHD